MLKDIIAVEPLENYQLRIRFEDGVEGIVDISQIIKFTGIFAPLQDKEHFAKVEVNLEVGTHNSMAIRSRPRSRCSVCYDYQTADPTVSAKLRLRVASVDRIAHKLCFKLLAVVLPCGTHL